MTLGPIIVLDIILHLIWGTSMGAVRSQKESRAGAESHFLKAVVLGQTPVWKAEPRKQQVGE